MPGHLGSKLTKKDWKGLGFGFHRGPAESQMFLNLESRCGNWHNLKNHKTFLY